MTAQVLNSELATIIQESKKKNTELRNAAEKSLQELKVLPSTSEAQVAADLRRRPHFVIPFLLACRTGSSKLALPAVTCIQRLIVTGGIPTERLKEVLQAFQECCRIGLDVQLKVLQSLPQLLQNYADALEGELQSSLLQVCTTLQHIKAVAVSSTASAILQQIISLLFEKVENEDDRANEITASAQIHCDGESLPVRAAAHDAYRVLEDLCLITEGQKSQFIPNATLSQAFGLELIETVLTNHGELFELHPELAHLLRSQLMPLITRLLSERLNFPVTVRTIRILCILLREHINTIHAECEVPLSLMNHFLDADGSMPWKRALCLETYRVIYSTPNLAIEIYALFDQQSGRKSIIQENLATFVRLAAEKPALIGLSQQSSFPTGQGSSKLASQEQALLEAGSVAGIIPGETGIAEMNAPGISTQWSSIKVPCLDQLDKSEPPSIPDTYPYSLVLTCLNGLSETLAKTVLPLTVHTQSKSGGKENLAMTITGTPMPEAIEDFGEDGARRNGVTIPSSPSRRRARTLPGNPLNLTDHPSYAAVQTVAELVDSCWPAILASSSTFLYAALDAEFYRGLIRSFQKFTQVAGLLRLPTPRDAFLTTLAKAAVPPNLSKVDSNASAASIGASPRLGSTAGAFASVENFLAQASLDSPTTSKRVSLDISGPSLSQRNLMCLRALINLAIALGSILDQSWPIILENLQRADNILAQSSTIASARDYRSGVQGGDRYMTDAVVGQTTVSSEIAAVESAISRLLQSTSEYSSDAFLSLLTALCNLIPDGEEGSRISRHASGPPPSLRRTSSMSSITHVAIPQARNLHFAIAKLGEVARINLLRLSTVSNESGWTVLTEKLLNISTSPFYDSVARLMAADVLGNVAVGIAVATASESPEIRSEVQKKSLTCLEAEIHGMYENLAAEQDSANGTDLDVHRSALEALRAILEQCGESLIAGWRIIFNVVNSAFKTTALGMDTDSISEEGEIPEHATSRPISTKIARSAFASVQLICSDFLASLKKSRVVILIDIMSRFCSQTGDLNISLTTITLFRELSDFLQSELENVSLELNMNEARSVTDIEASVVYAAEEGSFVASWLILQSRLALMTSDHRADVRNGAIHTIFRILDHSGDRLSPNVWQVCIQGVLFQMLSINIDSYLRSQSTEPTFDQSHGKNLAATSEIVLKGLASVFATHSSAISALPSFQDIWRKLLLYFSSYIELESSAIAAFTFNALSQILTAAEKAESLGLAAVNETVSLWESSVPKATEDAMGRVSDYDKALVAYVGSLKQIYRLIQPHITDTQIQKITINLQQCIIASSPAGYTSDVDTMTELQTQTLQSLNMLRTDLPNVPTTVIKSLAHFVVLPYSVSTSHTAGSRSLSFIAFSKRAMELLKSAVEKHVGQIEVFDDEAISTALGSLAHCISLKYKWERQGKEPSMWRKATSAAVDVIKIILPAARKLDVDHSIMSGVWSQVVDIARYIGEADQTSFPTNKVLLADETFDLTSFGQLRQSLTSPAQGTEGAEADETPLPWLGDYSIPDSIQKSYVAALFRTSLMHDSSTTLQPSSLTDIYTTRPGRTHDDPFNPRLRMSYSCLDELCSLVAAYPGPPSPSPPTKAPFTQYTHTLAQVAFPYLLLRLALPLHRYIADQPLRGRLPTPTSQRLELLYVLRKARELRCAVGLDARAAGGAPVLDPTRRHLEWLVPLVNRARGIAGRDRGVAEALQGVLDVALGIDGGVEVGRAGE